MLLLYKVLFTNIKIGVIPLVFTVTWDRQTELAAFVSPIVGLFLGLTVWIGTVYHYYDEVTVASLGGQLPCMFGALTALFLPGLLSIIISTTIKPKRFDWDTLREAQLIVSKKETEDSLTIVETDAKNGSNSPYFVKSESNDPPNHDIESDGSDLYSNKLPENNEKNRKLLSFYLKVAYGAFIFALLITWVVWPLPLYRDWIWSKTYFQGYITVSLIWVYAALLVIGVYPLIDGRHSFIKIFWGVYNDYFKQKK